MQITMTRTSERNFCFINLPIVLVHLLEAREQGWLWYIFHIIAAAGLLDSCICFRLIFYRVGCR